MADYKKFLRDNDVDNNILLGTYDADDKYVVSKEVISELIKLRKVITAYKQDYMLCEAKISNVTLKFTIKFFEDPIEDKKYSSLYLEEKYKTINKTINLQTFLINYSDFNDFAYLDKIKEKLNLVTKEELGDGKDISNSSVILETIIQNKQNVSKKIIVEMGDNNKKYINEILKALKMSGKYDMFQKLIKERMKDIKGEKNTAKYYALLKGILDELIIEKYDELDEKTRKWLEQINQNYIILYKSKKSAVLAPPKQEEAQADKKKDDKKKKAAGGGGAKKKDAKKEKKPSFEIGPFDFHEPIVYDDIKRPTKLVNRPPTRKPQKQSVFNDLAYQKSKDDLFKNNEFFNYTENYSEFNVDNVIKSEFNFVQVTSFVQQDEEIKVTQQEIIINKSKDNDGPEIEL